MNPILLVAVREIRQIAATRSFWITLLILPLALAVGQVVTFMTRPPAGSAYVLVDPTGAVAPAVRQTLEISHQGEVLSAAGRYADKWRIAPPPGMSWPRKDEWATEAEIAAFVRAGGVEAAQREFAAGRPKGAPEFKPPSARFILIPPPPGVVVDQGPDRFGETIAAHLKKDVATPVGERPLALAAYVPAEGGAAATTRIWTNGRASTQLIETIRGVLNARLRGEAFAASGLPADQVARIGALNAPVAVITPPAGAGRERMMLQSALPVALTYLLVMSLMMSGSLMLNSTVEERSNKLLEAVLAAISPGELMYGKLIGVTAVGFTMILVWIACAVGAAFYFQGAIADFLRPALASVGSPWVLAALLFYFAAGYIVFSMVFLAIGSVSDSMQEAQGYLTPVLLILTLPVFILLGNVLQNPDGPLPRILSWVPIYTPFAMMARIGGGVAPLEIVGTGLLLIAFAAVEVVLLGRIFRASILQAGQPLKPGDFLRLMAARQTA